MLPELAESEAQGDIAGIYREIRESTQVPYVSSLQRHLATRPGWLPWCWSVVGPGFRDGRIPSAVWSAAANIEGPRITPIERDTLRTIGVCAVAENAIHNVLDSFIRVSPTNLGFSGIIRRVLLSQGVGVSKPQPARKVTLAALAPLPELVNVDDLADPERDVLMTLSTTVDGQVFIPGLYRMLAHWPAWLARVAAELVSVRDVADHACVELAEGIDALIPALMQGLPISDPPLTGGAAEAANVVDAIDRYRETSPQMVVYCKMLKSSLPPVMPLT